ncbi:MAG: hypothetical protein AAFZ87_05120 [Planctomycetota bacterium]
MADEAVPARPVTGAPEVARFDGILEGGVADAGALRAAVAAVPHVPCDLRLDGGRFTLLFVDDAVDGRALDVDGQDALLAALEGVARVAAPTRPLESTLRGTLVYGARVVETLFTVDAARSVVPVSRERGRTAADGPPRGGAGEGRSPAELRADRNRGLLLAAVLVVGSLLAAWQRGYLGAAWATVTGATESSVERDTGPFGDTVEIALEPGFFGWHCVVTRGSTFPATPAEADALEAAAATNAERAAARAVASGGNAWLRALDSDGEVTRAVEIDLAPLLEDDGRARVEFPVRPGLAGVTLELSAGTDAGGK